MATAAVDSEEASVSCLICFEPYRNPKSLKCGHVLCTPCIDKLIERSFDKCIKCSICREISQQNDLRRDFTMEENVEKYFKRMKELRTGGSEQDITSHKATENLCEVCQNKPSLFHCKECSQLMCVTCRKLHARIEATRRHHILDFDEIKTDTMETIETLLNQYEDGAAKCKRALDLSNTHQKHSCQHAEKIHEEITELCSMVVQKCSELSSALLVEQEKLTDSFARIENEIKDFQSDFLSRETFLKELLHSNDTKTLCNHELLDGLIETATMDSQSLQETLDKISALNDKIVLSGSDELSDLLENLTLVCPSGTSKSTKTNKSLFSLSEKPLHKKRDIPLDEDFFRVSAIDGQLWVYGAIGSNSIHVYNNFGIFERELEIDNGHIYISSCSETDEGDIFAAIGNALVHISPEDGSIIDTISHGNYSYVVAKHGAVYARTVADKRRFQIFKFRWEHDECVLEETINIKHNKELSTEFAVTSTSFVLIQGKYLVFFGLDGKFKSTKPIKCIEKDECLMCTSDFNDNLLILAHEPKNQVVVKPTSSGKEEAELEVEDLTFKTCSLWSGSVDRNQNLWFLIRLNLESRLVQYSK